MLCNDLKRFYYAQKLVLSSFSRQGSYMRAALSRKIDFLVAETAACTFLTCSEPVRAGVNEWTNLGPFGGFIKALAIDPQNTRTIYGATHDHSTFPRCCMKLGNRRTKVPSHAHALARKKLC